MCVFFQAEDGIRDLVRSRGLGDVYKRQGNRCRCLSVAGLDPSLRSSCEIQLPVSVEPEIVDTEAIIRLSLRTNRRARRRRGTCLLYTSDAADERSSVDLGGRRIIKKKKKSNRTESCTSADD